jgi:hypothetical protein
MTIKLVGIVVVNGKAYLPSLAETKSGLLIQVDPVYEVEIEEGQLVAAIENMLSGSRTKIPDLTREEWKKRKDPVLLATRNKSWKELARKGFSYGLEWTDKGIRLDIPKLDQQGRWEVDPNAVRIFPHNTPIRVIVKTIIDHVQTRLI